MDNKNPGAAFSIFFFSLPFLQNGHSHESESEKQDTKREEDGGRREGTARY
jgi:hypothetical protein